MLGPQTILYLGMSDRSRDRRWRLNELIFSFQHTYKLLDHIFGDFLGTSAQCPWRLDKCRESKSWKQIYWRLQTLVSQTLVSQMFSCEWHSSVGRAHLCHFEVCIEWVVIAWSPDRRTQCPGPSPGCLCRLCLGHVLDWTGVSGPFGKGKLPAGCWHRNHFKNSALLFDLFGRSGC